MVIVLNGRALMSGDSSELAIDLIAFMGSLSELKKKDYKCYKNVIQEIKLLIEDDDEEFFTLDIMKEFAPV